jgi:hypothetical protein
MMDLHVETVVRAGFELLDQTRADAPPDVHAGQPAILGASLNG